MGVPVSGKVTSTVDAAVEDVPGGVPAANTENLIVQDKIGEPVKFVGFVQFAVKVVGPSTVTLNSPIGESRPR
jgi:hypothetical protein